KIQVADDEPTGPDVAPDRHPYQNHAGAGHRHLPDLPRRPERPSSNEPDEARNRQQRKEKLGIPERSKGQQSRRPRWVKSSAKSLDQDKDGRDEKQRGHEDAFPSTRKHRREKCAEDEPHEGIPSEQHAEENPHLAIRNRHFMPYIIDILPPEQSGILSHQVVLVDHDLGSEYAPVEALEKVAALRHPRVALRLWMHRQ